MRIGDNVWVITQDDDDGLMVALPEVPKSGTITSTQWCREKEFYYVRVDNDTLYVWPSNIFLSEDLAWAEWKYRMEKKCLEIQEMIDNRFHV